MAGQAINRCKRLAVVAGIKYQRLGDEHYYAQELFEQEELTGYLKNMLTEMQKSVYEQVVYDSDTEAAFADELEKNDAIKVYAKLPGWFKVPTPLGTWRPRGASRRSSSIWRVFGTQCSCKHLLSRQRLDFIVDPMQDVGESGLDSVPRTLYVPRHRRRARR